MQTKVSQADSHYIRYPLYWQNCGSCSIVLIIQSTLLRKGIPTAIIIRFVIRVSTLKAANCSFDASN